MDIAFLCFSKTLWRKINVSLSRYQIKGTDVFHGIQKIVFFVNPIGHEQKPGTCSECFTRNVVHQFLNVIAAVGWICDNGRKGWGSSTAPNLVAVLFLVIHVGKSQIFQIFFHGSVAIVRVVYQKRRRTFLFQMPQEWQNMFVCFSGRLAVVISFCRIWKVGLRCRRFFWRFCCEKEKEIYERLLRTSKLERLIQISHPPINNGDETFCLGPV